MILYMLLFFVLENGEPVIVPMEHNLIYESETECMDAAVKLYLDNTTVIHGACTPYIDKNGESA